MTYNVNIINQEDQSVNQLVNKTAKELHAKYNKQRKIKEKFLKKKTPIQIALEVVLNIVCVTMLVLASIACFSSINSSLNRCLPSFFGCTNMVISSHSMVKSGYEYGDNIVIHSVKTDTLNVGDKIAFYVYPYSYINFNVNKATNVSDVVSKTEYSLTPAELFGFKNQDVKNAAKASSQLVFHHVYEIYEDENGTRWFKTKGSSNLDEDDWYVKETLVVGIEDESAVAQTMVNLLEATQKPYGLLIIIIPAAVVLFFLVLFFLRSIQIAKLELDCVEEKRKITDTICVRNNVGYQMSNKTKYKILAQAPEKDREEYIKLLWKDGRMPDSLQKYYMRKRILLQPNKDLLELNRTCEQMFKKGKKPTEIAEFYLTEKQKIEERAETIKNRLKTIDKHKAENKKKVKKKF